jgi:hypothetical protein
MTKTKTIISWVLAALIAFYPVEIVFDQYQV